MLDVITKFLSQFKIYFIIAAIALYPIVWFFGDEHGKGIARLQDAQAVVKEDKSTAVDNKKAADAALQDEADLSKKNSALENKKDDPLPPITGDPCQLSPDRLQYLNSLQQGNK